MSARLLGLSLGLLASLSLACDGGAKKTDPASSSEKADAEAEVEKEAEPEKADKNAETEPEKPEAPAAETGEVPDDDAPQNLAAMRDRIVEIAKSGDYGKLSELTYQGKDILHQHSADGTKGPERKMNGEDGAALAANFVGEEFLPTHYIGEALKEFGGDEEAAKAIVLDESKNTIAYDGISGHWGVIFTFGRTRGGGWMLMRIDTWDEAP